MAFAPIPITPLVIPSDPADSFGGGGGGGGGMVTKFFALPLIVLLPIFLPIVLAIVLLGGGGGGGGGGGAKPTLPGGAGNNTNPFPMPPRNNTRPNKNNNNNKPRNQNRKRRQAEKNKTDSSSSAFPSMSIAQVERLTQVVYAAINSQECIQRLLCEVGSLSRSFSDTTRTVTKAVEDYVPEKLKDSFNIFAKAEKCEQYKCGSVKVKN